MSGTIAVANGGTGVTTLATNNVLLGNGTSTLQTVAPGTSGNVLTSNGSTWQSVPALPSGTITMWPTGTPPTGWLLADGSAVSRVTYATLFTVITTTFGIGDGVSTFNLPNYTDRMPIGAGSTYAVAATGGSKDATLVSHNHTGTTDENGGHSHSYVRAFTGNNNVMWHTDNTSGIATGQDNFTGGSVGAIEAVGNHSHGFTTSTQGASATNANLPPYLGIRFIIKT